MCWLLAIVSLALVPGLVNSETVTYDYDEIGRLKKATYGDGRSTTYTIDPAGNRLNVTTTPAPDTTPPSAPGTPTFENIGETTARARWTAASDNVGVVGYEYRVGGGSWIPVGNVLLVNLTGLAPGATQTFSVRAVDAAPNAGPASSAPLTTIDVTPPGAPSVSVSNIGETSATLSWGVAPDNVGIQRYEYRLDSGSWVNAGTAQSASLSGLVPDTSYAAQVRGIDAAQLVGAAGSTTFLTTDVTPPTTPSSLSLSAVSETVVSLTWGPASDNKAVTSYDYHVTGPFGAVIHNWTNAGNGSSVQVGGLQGRTAYTVQLRARDRVGNAGPAVAQSITMPDFTPPPTPTSLSFENLGTNKVDVHWLAPYAPDVIANEYSLNGGPWTVTDFIQAEYLTGLAPSTTYTISIRQRDDAGNVSGSLTGQFTTTEVWYPVANASGQIVASAAHLYRSQNDCEIFGDWAVCYIAIIKKYGNLGLVWSWYYDTNNPYCVLNQSTPGYRAINNDCSVEASSAAYGQ